MFLGGEGVSSVRSLARIEQFTILDLNYFKFVVRNSVIFTRHIYSVLKKLTTLLTRAFSWKLEGLNGMPAF